MSIRLSILLMFLVCLAGCDRKACYIAAPFFTEEAFSQVTPGMSESEVRDLIGYPFSRFGPSEPDRTVLWEYSAPGSAKPPLLFQHFSVKFGPDGRVVDKLACEGSWEEHEGVQGTIEAFAKSRRMIGDLNLTSLDGASVRMDVKDPGLYVFLLDTDGGEDTCLINTGPQWFQDAVPALQEQNVITGIRHVYIGARPDLYQNLFNGISAEISRDYFLKVEPELSLTVRDRDSLMLLYRAGTLWSVPPADGHPNAELGAADQEWLIRRLGAGR